MTRFENLLALLRHANESTEALGGRVVYRIKDDIRDWNNQPLFPPRQVNEPLVIDLGPEYRAWISNIYAFYKPPKDGSGSEPKRRAAGWRCAQALQWAASSPQAGLGYLVRQAVRAGWDLGNTSLRNALAALRPYRLGSPDESVEQLFQRIMREVNRQRQEQDVEDIDDDDGAVDTFNVTGLEKLLVEGLEILTRSGDDKWQHVYRKLLLNAGDEKVVLFAQPIETVIALAKFLERQTGRPPALIIGGQADWERNNQVDAFRSPTGPQFLVSSRAGGEGINLQVARRLIHIDVPWNPMDLEQRVGRVHRFGSRRTILVDTVVVKDSREADAYRIARRKLELIASTLVESERFEAVFARVMCLLPPEELQSVLIRSAQTPFDREDQDLIAKMVQQGFHAWKDFHEKFGDQQKVIRQQDPGLVNWSDLSQFLTDHAKARPLDGYKSVRFTELSGETMEEIAPVLGLEDGSAYLCGETSGAFVTGPDGQTARQIGLNIRPVAEVLRRQAFPRTPTGAALLRWPTDYPLPLAASEPQFGVLAFLRQTVRTDQQAGWAEIANSLHCYIINAEQVPVSIIGSDKGNLLRGLFKASVRSKVDPVLDLVSALREKEGQVAHELRRPNERELQLGIRHAVTPLFAAVVG